MLTKRKLYPEAAHHLLFMAWLHRIVNAGGSITREYAAGLGRLDLCIEFAGERFAFELKLQSAKARTGGLEQLAAYLDRLSLASGWLVIFQRSFPKDLNALGIPEIIEYRGKTITLIGL